MGTYQATVTVSSTVSGVASKMVQVTFVVAPPAPSIGLGSSSVSFQAFTGGANPASQPVSVTNGGGGTLSGLSSAIVYTDGSGWLSATLGGTTAPATLTIQPTTGALAAGTYHASVTISSTVSGVASKTIMVTFTVDAPPVIAFTPAASCYIPGRTNSFATYSTRVAVENFGGGTLAGLSVGTITYNDPANDAWLTATFDGTSAPTFLELTATTRGFSGSTLFATVPITSTSPGANTINYQVNFALNQNVKTLVDYLGLNLANFGGPSGVTVRTDGNETITQLDVSVSYTGTSTNWVTTNVLGTNSVGISMNGVNFPGPGDTARVSITAEYDDLNQGPGTLADPATVTVVFHP
jgi:hypothetical protein